MDEDTKIRLLCSFIAGWLIFSVLCLLLIFAHRSETVLHYIKS